MIKYKLICKSCQLLFDSWFSSSKEYEKLKSKKFLNCINCNSKKVEKSLMAPKLINKQSEKKFEKKIFKIKEVNQKIKEYKKFINSNFKYVGKNFAYEAREIHYNVKKEKKGIFGTASNNEIKELKEEGINTVSIPWIDDKNN